MPRRPTPPRRKAPHHTGRPWLRLRLQVLDRDNWRCMIPECDKRTRTLWRDAPTHTHTLAPSVDLIIPKQHGGSDKDPANLRAAHFGCNAARGNRTRTPRTATRWTTSKPRVTQLDG